MLPTLSPCVSSTSHPRGSLTSSNTVFTTFSRAFSYPRRTESFINKTPSLLPLKTAGIRNAAKQPASPARAKSGSFPPQTHPRGASPDRNRDFFQTRDRWRQLQLSRQLATHPDHTAGNASSPRLITSFCRETKHARRSWNNRGFHLLLFGAGISVTWTSPREYRG